MTYNFNGFSLGVDFENGLLTSLIIGGKERLVEQSELFRVCLRDKAGVKFILNTSDSTHCKKTNDGAVYDGFSKDIKVRVFLCDNDGEAHWHISVTNNTYDYFVEWVDFPMLTLPALIDNNALDGGKILYPYNEGALVSDMDKRESSWFPYYEPEYPSLGAYSVFPNMVFAQMLAYLWKDVGLYIGAHDAKRGVKDINFYKSRKGVTLRFRLFCGVDFGESFDMDYPIVFSATSGKWECCAERYRRWFEENLPPKIEKISASTNLPSWYEESPLVVTYPIRGLFDQDEMKPNRLYPYSNALPILERIKKECDSKLLVLLMHWEGTAPWAPPYVWQPFGGEKIFNEFRDALHKNGDLLGVYCSGFGYTLQSNLVKEYNKEDEYNEKNLESGMCADVDGKVKLSRICTAQRVGYDICPASKTGREILDNAYCDLLTSGVDYAQILDQNHGGGQYFCYSRKHGHPPAPGTWMTENMQNLLSGWNMLAPNVLLGCESASAEPFIGNLRFSDNRFELNYRIGVPVPLYAYIYHEYLRNFMGNQVSCPLRKQDDENLLYRLAYSFSIGDAMTLVLSDDGFVRSKWGRFLPDHIIDQEKVFKLVKNLTTFYKNEAKPYLYNGRMITPPLVECEKVDFLTNENLTVTLPSVLCSAWQSEDGSKAIILVNSFDCEVKCKVENREVVIPALNAIKL